MEKNMINEQQNKLKEQYDLIMNTFYLKNKEMSEILNISLIKLNLSLLDNKIENELIRQKFLLLFLIAKEWLELGYPKFNFQLKEMKYNNQTIFEILKELDKEKCLFFGKSLLKSKQENKNL